MKKSLRVGSFTSQHAVLIPCKRAACKVCVPCKGTKVLQLLHQKAFQPGLREGVGVVSKKGTSVIHTARNWRTFSWGDKCSGRESAVCPDSHELATSVC